MHLGRKYKLVKLLEDTPESWYWMGFLLADGHFSTKGRVKVTLCEKDIDHLKRFIEFTGFGKVSRVGKYVSVSVMDVSTVGKLMELFSIQSNKTYNPPNLSSLSADQLFCLSIGFIDGDGHISRQHGRKGSYITIKVHSSWKSTLQEIFPDHTPYIQNSGYAVVNISDTMSTRAYKTRALLLNLPILNRKWDIIDETFISKYEVSTERLPKILKLVDDGLSQKEIAKIVGISQSWLSTIISKHIRGK